MWHFFFEVKHSMQELCEAAGRDAATLTSIVGLLAGESFLESELLPHTSIPRGATTTLEVQLLLTAIYPLAPPKYGAGADALARDDGSLKS